jgi:hypothetical protein
MKKKELRKIIKEVLEESLWDNINAKRKSGRKPARKGSKAYKAAVAAGKRLMEVEEGVDDPVKPGILKDRLGKLSCSKVRSEKAKLKDKGTHYAKALQRYLNYHCQ